MSTSPDRRALHCAAKCRLYQILTQIEAPLSAPFAVTAHDGQHVAELRLRAESEGAAAPPARPPGNFFSPLELLVWNALAAGAQPGKAIAEAVKAKLEGKLKYVLANLVEREVIVNDERGYSRSAEEES